MPILWGKIAVKYTKTICSQGYWSFNLHLEAIQNLILFCQYISLLLVSFHVIVMIHVTWYSAWLCTYIYFRCSYTFCHAISTFFAFLIFVYVAVLCKNLTLFHCVFRSYYRFWRAVTYYFRYRWGSYALWIIDTFTQHVWAPPLTEVLLYSASNTVMQSKYAMK